MVKKILNQREIDAILGKARADEGKASPRCVEPCNFHNTGQMSDQYARFMTSLYEAYARSVSNSLGAYNQANILLLQLLQQQKQIDALLGTNSSESNS